MATQPEVIKQSEIVNLLVIDRTTMESIGRVEVLWMYPPAHKVLGFVCKSGLLGAKKSAFNLAQIHTLSASSVLVSSAGQETDGDRVSQLESLIDCEVWSEAGFKIGKVVDCLFNLQTGVISAYLVTSGRLAALTEGILQLLPSQIVSIGRKRVLVSEASGRSLTPYRPGLRQRMAQVSEALAEEYQDITYKAQTVTQQAKERVQDLAVQAKETAQTLSEQLLETTQTFTQQAIETGQSLAEQLREPPVSETEPKPHPTSVASTWNAETASANPSDEAVKADQAFGAEPEVAPISSRLDENEDFWGVKTPLMSTSTAPLPTVDSTDEWDIETPPETPTVPRAIVPPKTDELPNLEDLWADETTSNEQPDKRTAELGGNSLD
jgi:uncharacterized protein YrrD